MDLYLMQHGVALTQEQDPARPLSDEGRADVQQVVRRTQAAGVHIDVCVHSGKLRAEQTARVLADGLDIGAVGAREGLDPSDAIEPIARWLADDAPAESVALVGHLPFLDRLASFLVTGQESGQAVRFRNAGLVKLVPKQDAPGYSVAWVLVPELA